jgi:hypothetical protein
MFIVFILGYIESLSGFQQKRMPSYFSPSHLKKKNCQQSWRGDDGKSGRGKRGERGEREGREEEERGEGRGERKRRGRGERGRGRGEGEGREEEDREREGGGREGELWLNTVDIISNNIFTKLEQEAEGAGGGAKSVPISVEKKGREMSKSKIY